MTNPLLFLYLLSTLCLSAIPRQVAWQGVITDAAGNPKSDGSYEIIFSLYDATDATTALWSEAQTLTSANGIITTTLGSTTPLSLPFDKQYWLGIKVGNENELEPRTKLSTAAYSVRADTSEYAKAYQMQSSIDLDTLNVNDAIGIGIRDPTELLHIKGTRPKIFLVDERANQNHSLKLTLSGSGSGATGENWFISSHAGGSFNISSDSGNAFSIGNNGNVGIGITSPQEKLEVGGKIAYPIDSGVINTIASMRINIDSDNNATHESFSIGKNQTTIDANNTLFVVQENGNVGIGTTSPVGNMTIKGGTSGANLYFQNDNTGYT
ncbi:MAG: hypothetical protein GF398_12185, partial [Chitinivibrionales bacterium]|nr:hypothetical protein [Chitinivibrionales bacterium]